MSHFHDQLATYIIIHALTNNFHESGIRSLHKLKILYNSYKYGQCMITQFGFGSVGKGGGGNFMHFRGL